MAEKTLNNVIIQLRSGSATQWAASSRILAKGEPGVETDSGRIKIGDGSSTWANLPWSGAQIEKSDNGSITVNGNKVEVYTLPTATADVLGGIKVGSNLSISDGVLSADQKKLTFDSTPTADSENPVTSAGIKAAIDAAKEDVTGGAVASADKLTTARTISLAGAATGSVQFDGTKDVSITTTLKDSGAVAGEYTKVTVDAKGIVTKGATLVAADIPNLTLAKITDAGTAAAKDIGIAEGNVPVLGTDGKLDTKVIPSLAITDTFTAENEAAMLKLAAQKGDICIRTDGTGTWILVADGASEVDNWKQLNAPTDAVTSVNGKTGTVVLTTSDVTEGTNLYYTDERAEAKFRSMSAADLTGGDKVVTTEDTLVLVAGEP